MFEDEPTMKPGQKSHGGSLSLSLSLSHSPLAAGEPDFTVNNGPVRKRFFTSVVIRRSQQ